jgi:hypothetical protein
MRKYLLFIILLSGLCLGAKGQSEPEIDLSGLPEATTASSLRYWFDTDANTIKTTSTLNGSTTIDASGLVEGIHTVHYQIVDNKNIAGIPTSKMFIKLDTRVNAKAKKLRYWFDTDAANATVTEALTGGTIDASKLVEGIHTLHYQIVDDQDNADIPVSALFIKLEKKSAVEATAIRYWFDENDANMVQVDIKETMTIDVGKLRKGEHYLHLQLIAANGEVMPSRSGSFEMVTKIVRGDANDDDVINVADIVMIVNYIEDPENLSENFNADNADANDDGVVNADDIVEITYISMNGKSSWTKVGTGTFSYVHLWPSDYVEGVPQPQAVEGYELYQSDSKPGLYMIKKWGLGTPVNYIFTWDKETNVIATQKGLVGYSLSTYGGDMFVQNVIDFNKDKTYESYPSHYDPATNTFYFYNVYFGTNGSMGLRDIPETFVVEWLVP